MGGERNGVERALIDSFLRFSPLNFLDFGCAPFEFFERPFIQYRSVKFRKNGKSICPSAACKTTEKPINTGSNAGQRSISIFPKRHTKIPFLPKIAHSPRKIREWNFIFASQKCQKGNPKFQICQRNCKGEYHAQANSKRPLFQNHVVKMQKRLSLVRQGAVSRCTDAGCRAIRLLFRLQCACWNRCSCG